MSRCHISIVSPVYCAEKIVPILVEEVIRSTSLITEDFEIILVEDGSHDESWEAITREAKKDPRVKGIRLSRNFGQHYAITAGLDFVDSDWTVVMDCDLQDNPTEIVNLYNKAIEGNKIVLARRIIRIDKAKKKISSKLFYKVLSFLSGVKQDETIANYGIYHRTVIHYIMQMREPFRNFAAIVKWVGFRPASIVVKHSKRMEGTSSYNFKKLLKLAGDTILAYSNKPLYYIIGLGFTVFILSLIVSLIVLVKYFNNTITILGYTSLILSIWLLGGLIIMFLGVVGLYIGKIFEGIKNRPIYIVSDTENIKINI